jgi:methyl-accepting chemotaxis protein
MSETPAKRLGNHWSIQTKVDLVLVVLFMIMLAATVAYQYSSQREMVEDLVRQQAEVLADSYFDNINTLMLSGVIANRAIPRKKVMSREEVLDARIVRSHKVNDQFGAGPETGKPVDDFDRRGIAGEEIEQLRPGKDGRILTVVRPLHAGTDFRGTNCLGCHMVKEGDVMGAVRIDYSLKKLDAHVMHEVWVHIGLNTALMIVGLVFLSYLLRRLIVRPIVALRETVHTIEQNSDLSLRANPTSGDEIGQLALALNAMLTRFSTLIGDVMRSAHKVVDEAQQLAGITEKSIADVRRQQLEIDQVASAMTEMEQNSHEVAGNAASANEATGEVDRLATTGGESVALTVSAMESLASEIDGAASVVQKLELDSEGIGRVVEVITTIAEQTNLLALNAAIEAARAGEQGRGFAVVADEVRTLATRTHASTKEIQGMVESLQAQARNAAEVMVRSQTHADDSVQRARQAGELIDQINTALGGATRMNEQIAGAAHEQSTVASEMNRNVAGISEVTDHTAHSAELIAQVSDRLSELATDLQTTVDRFRT